MKNRYIYYSGLGIVLLTHVYMLWKGLPESQMTMHAIINLVAAGLIYFGVKK
jgi:hypothetical protein